MELKHVEFYQAVRLPIKTKSNYNSVNDDIILGVKIVLDNHLVEVSHCDWDEKVLVPTANVRFMTVKNLTESSIKPVKIETKEVSSEPIVNAKAKKVVKSKK